MARLIRPLIFVGIISFLLGIWISLRRTETSAISRILEPNPIVILTDEPEWWRSVVKKAERESVAQIRLMSPPRRRWADILSSQHPPCSLVTVNSYFVGQFLAKNWLAPSSPITSGWWDQIHPDFRDLPTGAGHQQFLPLLWGVTAWMRPESGPNDSSGRLEVTTSLDEGLMTAMDLGPDQMEPVDPDTSDASQTVRHLWSKVSPQLSLSIGQSEYAVPIAPIKARQFYVDAPEALKMGNDDALPNHGEATLWYFGIGLCPNQTRVKEINLFVHWLLQPDNIQLLGKDSARAMTASSADNEMIPPEQRPSFLRKFPLGLIKERILPWDLAAAWAELWTAPQETSASR